MKFSVIIPTYNRSNMVLLSIDSMLKQDFPKSEYEIIIVDNNSLDDTESVVCTYIHQHKQQANISYVREMRQGDVYARNSGAALAKGDYLYFTDDDALFDTNMLSCMCSILDEYPRVGMVGSRIVVKWDEEPDRWIRNYEYLLGAISCEKSGYVIKSTGMCIPNGSLAIRKEIFYQVGGNNMGQVGEYLVGNAEVGLFHKVREKGYLIAFTDDTTMWHMQIKAKNGQEGDIIRRLENIAISDAYVAVIENNDSQYRKVLKYKLDFIKYTLLFRRTKRRKSYFTYRANLKYNEWIDKYSNADFVRTILTKDCVLGAHYICPEVLCYAQYEKLNG